MRVDRHAAVPAGQHGELRRRRVVCATVVLVPLALLTAGLPDAMTRQACGECCIWRCFPHGAQQFFDRDHPARRATFLCG